MRGAVLYGPRDVRFEERDAPKIIEPTDAIIRISATCVCGSDLWPYRGFSRSQADADGARVLRHRRGGRQRGHVGQARAVRHRLVLRLRQHLSQLPGRLPVVVQHREFISARAGAGAARAAGGRHAGADAGRSVGRPDPEPAGGLRRPGHRLVRRRRGQREAGHRPSWSSATARSACSACSPPSRWAPSGSSR